MAKGKSKKKKSKWYPGKFAEKLGIGRKKKAKRLQKFYEKPGSLISDKSTGEERKKTAKRLAKEAAKDPKTGRVRKGAKGVESTSGGEYVKYGKKSKAAESFRSKFAKARKAGKSSFSWDGRSYSTKTADDVKKAKKAAKWEAGKKKGDESLAQLKKEGTYAEGGKVESSGGMFNWPSRDARNGGNK